MPLCPDLILLGIKFKYAWRPKKFHPPNPKDSSSLTFSSYLSFYYVCDYGLHDYLCATCMRYAQEGQKRASDPPGTGVSVVVSYLVGAGNQIPDRYVFFLSEPSLLPSFFFFFIHSELARRSVQIQGQLT